MLVKELQALCLDVRVLDEAGEVVDISGLYDTDAPTFNNLDEVEHAVDAEASSDEDDEYDGELADDESALDDDTDSFFEDGDGEYSFEDDGEFDKDEE